MTRPEEPAVPPWSLGWRLQRALAWADVSVQQMADELEVSRTTLSRWLHDVGPRPPRTIYLRAWAARCRVPFDWLAFGELPRMDSNHQPAGWRREATHGPARTQEILAFRKTIRLSPPAVRR